MKRKSYTARRERSGDWWAGVPNCAESIQRRVGFEHAESMVRDAIALFLDVPGDSFDVKVEPVRHEIQRKVGQARRVRGEAEALHNEAAIASADVAADLVRKGHLIVRDAGRVLGLSHQRIAQLLKPVSGGAGFGTWTARVQRTRFGDMPCSIARTLQVVSESWSPLIIRDVFLGASRFDGLQRNLGISRKMLTQRLAWMAERGSSNDGPTRNDPRAANTCSPKRAWSSRRCSCAMAAWGDR